MPKLKNMIVAHKAQMNQYVPGAIDIMGAFDNLIQPVFPHPLMNLSIIMVFEEINQPTIVEVRLNAPDNQLITKGEIPLIMEPNGVGKKILDLEKILIKDRGIYTIDVLEKTSSGLKFIASSKLFIAEYPPQRRFTPDVVAGILSKEDVIKVVKTEFRPYDNPEKMVSLQISLDPTLPLEEGYERYPETDKIVIEGKEYDLTGIRRQVEWMYGNPIPKQKEETEEEAQLKN